MYKTIQLGVSSDFLSRLFSQPVAQREPPFKPVKSRVIDYAISHCYFIPIDIRVSFVSSIYLPLPLLSLKSPNGSSSSPSLWIRASTEA